MQGLPRNRHGSQCSLGWAAYLFKKKFFFLFDSHPWLRKAEGEKNFFKGKNTKLDRKLTQQKWAAEAPAPPWAVPCQGLQSQYQLIFVCLEKITTKASTTWKISKVIWRWRQWKRVAKGWKEEKLSALCILLGKCSVPTVKATTRRDLCRIKQQEMHKMCEISLAISA